MQKEKVLDKNEVYGKLLAKHPSWTYDVIANMTPEQQIHALTYINPDEPDLKFETEADYLRWLAKQ